MRTTVPSMARPSLSPGEESKSMKIRTLAAALVVLALAGAPSAASLDDAVTSVKIHTSLLEKFGTDALGITIDVAGGNVVLSGAVDKKETRDGARSAALGVNGVSNVEN